MPIAKKNKEFWVGKTSSLMDRMDISYKPGNDTKAFFLMQEDLIDSSDNSHKPHVTGLKTKPKKKQQKQNPQKTCQLCKSSLFN